MAPGKPGTTETIKEGNLIKKTETNNWKERFCRLTRSTLYYSKSKVKFISFFFTKRDHSYLSR